MHLLYSLGELSSWAESVLQAYESSAAEKLGRFSEPAALVSHSNGAGSIPVVLVENSFGSQKQIRALRDSHVGALVIWFGKVFTKEDLAFAVQFRVYSVLEGIGISDPRFEEALSRAKMAAMGEEGLTHLLRTLKTVIMQHVADERETELLSELKTVVGKIEKGARSNEFIYSGTRPQSSDTQLPLHQSAALSDALLTVADMERTGTLQVSSHSLGQRGSIQFLQGKIVRAESGAVAGLKAIYRMFLWPDCQFQFARQQATEVHVEETVGVPVRDVCVHGEKLQREFNHLRTNVPPIHIRLELDPTALNASSRLEPDLFSCLASVVEFGKVSQVLDYNELPDVNLYKALIDLRRRRLIRVVSAPSLA